MNTKAQIKIDGWRCERCRHTWVARVPSQVPTVCPKCKSPYWKQPPKPAAKGPS